jgi:arabinofuranan 3-O-arabinosyltransferase
MVRDCHAFDGRIFWQAGLRMTKLRSMRGRSVRLRAFAHSACTVQTVDGFVPGGSYLLSMDARATHGAPARSCLWEHGPEGCARIPKLGRADGWIRYEEAYTPRPGTASLRLFLYADGGMDETGPTIVDYRNVRIRTLAPFAVSITEGADPRPAPPEVASARVGPSSFRAEVGRSEGPFLLSIPESAAPGWSISGVPTGRSVTPVEVDGYAQGWLISRGAPFSAEIAYAPDRWLRWAAAASAVGWIALMGLTAGRWVRRRRASDRGVGS